ncbi:hypothetical protein [Burkholderia contaminans]|uniref:hypothetical protein n=1 Tax=Burkholderia contaminans TaxID=488447 RepID=UPI001CF18522|nr:hypothetical protein [Burkholderia contaminans]MCA8099049.1 hypothetical protein [Burkholderia contaminans]
MTASASRTDTSQPPGAEVAGRRRSRVVALAVTVSLSVHLLGWFLLQRASTAAGPNAGTPPRIALRVELIPARPAPVASARDAGRAGPAAGGRGVDNAVRSTQRSAAIATSRVTMRSPSDARGVSRRQRETSAGLTEDRSENHPETASGSGPDLDWRRDLDAIGARQAVARTRSPAQAAVGALGAPSGGVAARRDTVDARLADGMSDARRADCQHAYSGAGLLALPMLALDAVRDTGCKW